MRKTQTMDIAATQCSKYEKAASKLHKVIESIFKDNFVRLVDKNSPFFEKEPINFRNYILNIFSKGLSKEVIALATRYLDRLVSDLDFFIKSQNVNKLYLGLLIVAYKQLQKDYKNLAKILSMKPEEIKLLDSEASKLLKNNFSYDKEKLNEYIRFLHLK